MALVLLIFLRLISLLVTEGALVNESVSFNITLNSSLTPDTNPSWVSPSGLFAFGFYHQDDGFAVGIWLETKPEVTVVWTANRDDPPLSSNSSIELTKDGWLVLHDANYGEKNLTEDQVGPATSACIYDSGNFVLYNNHSAKIWESFDYPCDTIVGGQELYYDVDLVSSVSDSQHSRGRFVLSMQVDGNLVAYPKNSEDSYWSTSTFETSYSSLKLNSSGVLYMRAGDELADKVLYQVATSSRLRNNEIVVYRATLNPQGNFILYSQIFTSNLSSKKTEWAMLEEPCEAKGICGVNSYCLSTSRNVECRCFPGFLFLNSSRNGKSLGCYRNFTDEEACSSGSGLQLSYNITAVENMELGGFSYSVMMNLGQEACSKSCLDDCNCWLGLYENGSCKMLKVPILYAFLNKSKLATLLIKTSFINSQLKDTQRQAPPRKHSEGKRLVSILAITLGFLALVCTLLASASFFFYKVHARRYQRLSENVDFGEHFTLRSFSFDELHEATDGFKEVIGGNAIGEVYKGSISEGKKAVAVKKLHRMFEGEGGFRAEITAIAQTHHRNLVRLLGFCIHGSEKLLVYEFMSNGSLADLLLTLPGWKERASMALDVARGILYLHQECETRIIHCNIKPHNILFDEFWTAKISDFGLLRANQSGTLTSVRGTKGYVAPEWYKNTLITTKVDIYSFGVVLLEILCCRGDMEIGDDRILPFSTRVYNCFVANELTRLIGDEDVDICMFEKMVKVGLLCVQDDPDARPSIKHVILMLEGTTDIPIPPSPSPSPTPISLI